MNSRSPVILLALALALAGCDRGNSTGLVGGPAPDFTVKDGSQTISLHDYRGKTVVLTFWASWCAPCIEEEPSLVNIANQMNGTNVVFLGVSIDEDADAYQRFLKEYRVPFTNVRDPQQSAAMKYGATGWPETYIIDKDGVIRRKFVGAVQWNQPELATYLKTL